jgi:hypothetical protein
MYTGNAISSSLGQRAGGANRSGTGRGHFYANPNALTRVLGRSGGVLATRVPIGDQVAVKLPALFGHLVSRAALHGSFADPLVAVIVVVDVTTMT